MIATAATIERIETLLVDVPTIRPHKLSVATMNCQTLVLVRVRCTDGIEGVGEATTIGGLAYGEESPESIKVNIDTYFAPLLQGMDATRPGAALARARKLFQGNRFAKCAIETALFDAQARRLGVPLSELFGGRRTDAVDVAWTLASGDTQRDIAEAEAMLDARRHRAFKLKIGSNAVADDVAHHEVAQEVAQYLGHPVTLGQPGLKFLPVSGYAATDAPASFVEALPDLLPVRVTRMAQGGYRIDERPVTH